MPHLVRFGRFPALLALAALLDLHWVALQGAAWQRMIADDLGESGAAGPVAVARSIVDQVAVAPPCRHCQSIQEQRNESRDEPLERIDRAGLVLAPIEFVPLAVIRPPALRRAWKNTGVRAARLALDRPEPPPRGECFA